MVVMPRCCFPGQSATRGTGCASARLSGASLCRLLRPQAAVTFTKYQGLGNDFILVDNRHQTEPIITPEQAVKLCDRNFGM